MYLIKKFSLIVLAALVSAGVVYADARDYTWTLTSDFGGPGQTGELLIAVDNADPISNAPIDISFDSDKITLFDESSAGNNLNKYDRVIGLTSIPQIKTDPPSYRIVFINTGAGDIAAGSGVIWGVKYKVSEDAVVGDVVNFTVVTGADKAVIAEYQLEIPEATAGIEFKSLPLQVANVGEELAIDLDVTDSTLTGLTYEMVTAPGDGAALNTESGEFTWTSDVAGSYEAVFYVTDGSEGDSLTVQIKINNAPEFGEIDTVKVNEGSQVEFTLEATDSDQDILVYKQLDSVVSGAELDSLTGQFVWPAGAATGTYDAEFSVSDGHGVDTVVVTIKINSVPILVEVGDQQGETGVPLELVLQVSDNDLNDTHIFHLLTDLEGLKIDSTGGIISWTPTEIGEFEVKVEVTDGIGADTLTIPFSIEQGPLALIIDIPGDGDSYDVAVGDTFKLDFEITNNGSELTRFDLVLPDGVEFKSALGLEWVPTEADAGENQFKIAFTNETGVADTVDFSVVVSVKDKPPVWARFDTVRVQQGQEVSQSFTAPGDEDPASVIVLARNLPEGAAFNTDNLTFTWTPTFDQEGIYQFTLLAIDIEGQRSSRVVNVEVSKTNRAPSIVYDEESFIGQDDIAIGFGVVATDPDGDELEITWSGLPEGALNQRRRIFLAQSCRG